MNCIDLIHEQARALKTIIESHPTAQPIATEDFGWQNWRWTGSDFRLAHVEFFNQDNFAVVHVCVFPHKHDPEPIFGFDVIAGVNKFTGVFLDLSPTVTPSQPFLNIDVQRERQRPDWGDIFSEHWLAARPSFQEQELIGQEAQRVLSEYLGRLNKSHGDPAKITQAQDHYCLQQQKNPHTRKALENLIGQEKTEYFMSHILFPVVSVTDNML